jgi:hypothetical protein
MEVVAGGPKELLTVRYVTAVGSDAEIGRTLAAAAQDAHGDLVRPNPVDPDVERVRRRWFELHDPARARRSVGVAEHFGIDPADLTVALDSLASYWRPPGCSVGFYPGHGTANGHALLARNMDFQTATLRELLGLGTEPGEPSIVADTWVVEMRPDHGRASVTVGFGDVLGSTDGFNDAGLTVALLAASVEPSLEPTNRPAVGLNESQVVQHLLTTCATAREARDALRLAKHYYRAMPCHFVVADPSGDCFVWEHSQHHNREIVVTPAQDGDGRIVCTNHLLHLDPDPTEPSADDNPATATKTHQRWSTMTALMAEQCVVTPHEVADQLAAVRFDSTDGDSKTIWHAVYDLHDTTVEISFLLDISGPTSRYSPQLSFALK